MLSGADSSTLLKMRYIQIKVSMLIFSMGCLLHAIWRRQAWELSSMCWVQAQKYMLSMNSGNCNFYALEVQTSIFLHATGVVFLGKIVYLYQPPTKPSDLSRWRTYMIWRRCMWFIWKMHVTSKLLLFTTSSIYLYVFFATSLAGQYFWWDLCPTMLFHHLIFFLILFRCIPCRCFLSADMGDVKSCIDTIMQCTLDFRAKLLAASLDNNGIRISISDELYSKVCAFSYIVRATLHYGQGPTIELWEPLKHIQRPYHGKLKLYYVQSWAFQV